MSELILLALVAVWCVGWIATADKILRDEPGDWGWIFSIYFLMFFVWTLLVLAVVLIEVSKKIPEVEVPKRYREE